MPKRVGTSMLANQRKKSRYRNVTTQNLRSLIPRSMIPETHFIDFTAQNPATGTFVECETANITVGDQRTNRTGNRIFMKSLDMTLHAPGPGRLSVLIPKDPTVGASAISSTNRYNHDDFTILHDEVFNPPAGGDRSLLRRKIPLNMERVYAGSTSSVVPTKNDLLVVWNSSNVATTAQIRIVSRLYFTG